MCWLVIMCQALMCFIYIFLLHPFCKVEITAPLYRGQSLDLESDWIKISTLPTSPTTISHLLSLPYYPVLLQWANCYILLLMNFFRECLPRALGKKSKVLTMATCGLAWKVWFSRPLQFHSQPGPLSSRLWVLHFHKIQLPPASGPLYSSSTVFSYLISTHPSKFSSYSPSQGSLS